jgi:iron complex outermembrane recepter protein
VNYSIKNRLSMASSSWRRRLLATTAVVFGLSVQAHAFAQNGEGADEEEFDIPPSEMTDALQSYSEQADVEILYSQQDVADKTTNGVDGSYSKEEALDEIIRDTDLVYEINDDGVVVIRTSFLDVRELAVAQDMPRREIRVAQVSEITGTQSQSPDDEEEKRESRDVITVTGTNIRGIAPESSPVRTFDRQDILNSGVSTAQDFIERLPQNFGGGSNVDTGLGLPNDVNSGFNGGGGGPQGASVNLRGLGSGSTLVLLNGHRIAPSSGIGDFVDISMIPASAIERIEVLTDGASSIYGADAVAGVVNFILRDDYDGVEASFRYGTVTQGDLDEYRASITGGKSWNTGNALFVYEYFNQENLSAADRRFSQGATLPNDLLPSQERHSVLASGYQEIMPNLELFADFTYSQRETTRDFTDSFGRTFVFIPSSENLNISAGGSWKVSDSWFVDFSGTYSDVHSEIEQSGPTVSMREIDSDIWVADAKVSGTVLSLPGGDLKFAIGGHYRGETFTDFSVTRDVKDREADRDVYAFFGEAFIPIIGPDNAVLGIKRLELNVSGRFEDYSDFGSTTNPKIGVLWSPFEALKLRGSYSTSFNPPPLGRVGAVDTTIGAFRTSFTNGLIGATPGDPSIADVVAFTVGGTGEDLDAENSRAFTGGLDFDEHWGRHDFSFTTTYFNIKFKNRLGSTPIPDGRSLFDAPNIAFNNPELFPAGTIIFSPPQSDISNLVNRAIAVFGAEDPFNAEIINLAGVVRNLALTSVSGFDFDLTYTYDSDIGALSLGLDGTLLQDFQQQGAVTAPLVEQVDTLFNPVNLKLRGRTGYAHNGFVANIFVNYTDDYRVDNTAGAMVIDSWTTVDVSLSYDTEERFENSILNDTIIRVSALNVFDQDPPFTIGSPTFGIFGFDATNASPLGRFISVELTKRF